MCCLIILKGIFKPLDDGFDLTAVENKNRVPKVVARDLKYMLRT